MASELIPAAIKEKQPKRKAVITTFPHGSAFTGRVHHKDQGFGLGPIIYDIVGRRAKKSPGD